MQTSGQTILQFSSVAYNNRSIDGRVEVVNHYTAASDINTLLFSSLGGGTLVV